jgi:hypothetical protein
MHVILLSYANTQKAIVYTINAINTLALSNSGNKIKSVLVIENSDYQWANLQRNFELLFINKTEKFNYNAFLNYGVKLINSRFDLQPDDYIACCNNDLSFDKNWLNIMDHGFDSVSPKCNLTHSHNEFRNITKGYRTAKELSGWCIVLKFKVWQLINGFDESITFWCSDDAYREQLINNSIEHYIVPTSIVNHLDGGSNTLKGIDSDLKKELTTDQIKVFNNKYQKNIFLSR